MSAFAPAQLPVAPKPLPDELLSSWLLRLAEANAVSLLELLDGLRWRYPQSLIDGQVVDYSIPEATLQALSIFGRAPLKRLRNLDLSRRVPQVHTALLLLRFPPWSLWCPRGSCWRVRYTFCPKCLYQQEVPHIRWDWCFAALIRCDVHRCALLDTCPSCGVWDPLSFSAQALPHLPCRRCAADLTQPPEVPSDAPHDGTISALETAYRAALSGIAPHPKPLDQVNPQAFQRFVEDMLQTLIAILSSYPNCSNPSGSLLVPRCRLLTMIAKFVQNASPTTDPKKRGARQRHSVALWTSLFRVLPASQGRALERASHYWPPALRSRFASALNDRRRKRWPYSPYNQALKQFSPGFRCKELLPYAF